MSVANELFEKHKNELDEFQAWIKAESKLPQNIEKVLLFRFLKVSEFNIEKAKSLLMLFLETRKNNPELFLNRDVLSEEFQRATNTIHLIPMKKNNHLNQKISIFRVADPDPNNYNPKEICRAVLALYDIRFESLDDDEVLNNGEIGICDLKGYSFRHLMKVFRYMWLMNPYFKYIQETIPTVIVQNHFVNASGIFNKMMALMRPFMKKELLETIKIHESYETLYDYLPRELLPNEYGGVAGCLDDIYAEWLTKVKSKRDYIANDDNWKLDD